ncbi:hypothetical protein CRM71_13860 [Prevotella jejuni]|uniref:Uncharacterized protein n=1 Tax=Prevotella jejuni TaxID=1177574 RepID=A0A2N9QRK9_9BACT|nr:hypothetical protein [Prevotella jejuni]AUI56342.1 hypothetical protein CRM71_13860 [Prevotella jejuni]SNR70052.1 hypothetical protein SAMN06265364_10544 [Prevotella jejuni]
MTNYEKWDHEFRTNNLFAFNNNDKALLYLKVRAICRKTLITQFLKENNLTLKSKKVKEQFPELYALLENKPKLIKQLDCFLRDRNNEWYKEMGVDEDKVRTALRKINAYEWGGDHNNSLDQYLVRRYVKVISDYDTLQKKAKEIQANAWNFVQTSWYNNWTSYLIESIFKKHKRVLSAIGEIKSVDFFIDNYPIDLKVTYFPNEFMEKKLKEKIGNKELAWLKKEARKVKISPDKNLSDAEQLTFLKEELENHGHSNIIEVLTKYKQEIIDEACKHPEELMKWLYKNQSARLFGAENRLFLVLVDTKDMKQSWKMKRAFTLIEPTVNNYLKSFNAHSLKEIKYTFNQKNYTSLSDIIFIIK